MKSKFLLVALITFGMVAASAGAGETLHTQEALQSNDTQGINFSEPSKVSFLDRISFSFLLSSVTGPQQVSPGDTITLDPTVDALQTYTMEGNYMVTEFYRCNDSGCDDPSQDTFLKAKSDYMEAPVTIEKGESLGWEVDYQTPEQEGYYAAVAYVSDGNGNLLTDSPKKIFKVGTPGSDDSQTEFSHEDMALSSTPSFTVDEESNTVTGTLRIENGGSVDMPSSHIVEMQVRPSGSGPLSFVSPSSDVCDSSTPNNVHKDYRLDAGDSRSISLTNQGQLEDGESYTVYFLTRTGCAPNEKVEPIYNSYNAGSFTLNNPDSGDGTDGSGESQKVVQGSKPQLTYYDSNGSITTRVHFKNKGGNMPDSDIVEMQVRPQGSTPLAFSSTTQVCDKDHPENVNKKYQLDSGESDSTTLSTTAVTEPGKYTVYLLTREGCAPDNEKVEPYYNSVRAGTVTIEQGRNGFVSLIQSNQNLFLIGGVVLIVVAGGVVFFRG